jgi:TolB-like protein/Flp pilus assembly protein TadD
LPDAPDSEEIRRALRQILCSRGFAEAERLRQLLTWLVEESLNGRADQIKESLIALEVFGRGSDWNPQSDALVRVQVRNLRHHLDRYYASEGTEDPVRLTIPKGRYAPHFTWSKPPPPEAPPTPMPPARAWKIPASAIVTLMTVTTLALFAAFWYRRPAPPLRLAVLPFENLSGQPGYDYLAAGLTEELTAMLARTPALRVAAIPAGRSTMGQEPEELAHRLGVRYLLSGSLRQADGPPPKAWSITARLTDGETSTIVWSDHYLRGVAELEAMPEEIARVVTVSLRIAPAAVRGAAGKASVTSAHDAYLRGLYLRSQQGQDHVAQARLAFQQAILENPSHVRARAALADSWLTTGFHDYDQAPAAFAAARREAELAVGVDPSAPEILAVQARIAFLVDWDAFSAETLYRNSLRLAPSIGRTHQGYALLLMSRGRHDEAVAEMLQARELDPLGQATANDLGVALYAARRYAEALAEARRILQFAPQNRGAHFLAGAILSAAGKPASAIPEYRQALSGAKIEAEIEGRLGFALAAAGRTQEARQLLTEMESGPRSDTHRAILLLGLGEREEALAMLSAAIGRHESEVLFLDAEPHFESLRGDPRFQALRKRVGLAR